MRNVVYVHPRACCESSQVGRGTRIWAFAHVMEGAVVGGGCNIGGHAFIERGARVGDGVVIKNHVCVWEGVVIEDAAFIGPNVLFTNDRFPRSRHLPQAAARYQNPLNWLAPTRVEYGASLGAGAVVVCGVTIGRFATVAAGAVVTADVPPRRLVAGNPARPIGWVCECGRKLDRTLTCPACAIGFVLHGRSIEKRANHATGESARSTADEPAPAESLCGTAGSRLASSLESVTGSRTIHA